MHGQLANAARVKDHCVLRTHCALQRCKIDTPLLAAGSLITCSVNSESGWKSLLHIVLGYGIVVDMGSHGAKGGFTLQFHSEGFLKPSRRKKGGRYNVRYICGFVPIIDTHCSPCKFDFSDSQGKKKIAAATPIATASLIRG